MGSSSRRTRNRTGRVAQAKPAQSGSAVASPTRATQPSMRTSRRKARFPLWLLAIGAGLVLIVGFVIYRVAVQNSIGQSVPILPVAHVAAETQPNYNSNPPTSGIHTAQPASWGVTKQPLPDIALVHNLEHGGIVIHYRPDLDAAQLQQLTQLAGELQRRDRKIVMAPRAENDLPITATAWGRMLKQQTLDADAIRAFFDAFINQGPEREP